MITEIYVSIDNSEFTKLDLHKDESFVMKYSKKDLQDITKVYAPFSQNFTFPATPKNIAALGFFGNTEVIKILPESKYFCKVYIDGILNETGILKVESLKYKYGKPQDFTGNFNTNILSLKDRIGDDLVSDLPGAEVNWTPKDAFNRLGSYNYINGAEYFTPLVSTIRVLSYSEDTGGVDNIRYVAGNSPYSTKVLNYGELRPAIQLRGILDLIVQKYGLTVNMPLKQKQEFVQAFAWCNGENFGNLVDRKLIQTVQFTTTTSPSKVRPVVDFTDSSTNVSIDSDINFLFYRIYFRSLTICLPNQTEKATISLVRKSDLVTVFVQEFDVTNGDNALSLNIPMYLFVSNEFEFFTYVRFSKPAVWRANDAEIRQSTFRRGYYTNNNTSYVTGCHKVDLIKALPELKVIDFLTSLFKTFNLSIYDSSPNDENLFFLTPQDIQTNGNVYSKTEVDYTKYADFKQVTKSVNSPYNYYNFKHKKGKYKSNSDFKKQFNIEYGQTYYPEVKPEKAKEFKVETNFTIVPPVLMEGNDEITTFYGFTDAAPSVLDSGVFRYTPNTEDFTIFYKHEIQPLTKRIGVQSLNNSNVLVNSELLYHAKVAPYFLTWESEYKTLAFSILRFNGVDYTNSLFSLYYSQFIQRVLNPNALAQDFELILPSNEIYLNDATIMAGNVDIPTGFRMQNEIIIGETKYEILEASIDKTTGKTKIKLLNF